MTKLRAASILTLAVAAGAVGELRLYASLGERGDRRCAVAAPPPAAAQTILYYRDPSGAPFWSATPKADAQGSAYLPVYDDAEPNFDPPRLVSLAAADSAEIRARRAQDSLLPQSDGACPTSRRCRRRTRWG